MDNYISQNNNYVSQSDNYISQAFLRIYMTVTWTSNVPSLVPWTADSYLHTSQKDPYWLCRSWLLQVVADTAMDRTHYCINRCRHFLADLEHVYFP